MLRRFSTVEPAVTVYLPLWSLVKTISFFRIIAGDDDLHLAGDHSCTEVKRLRLANEKNECSESIDIRFIKFVVIRVIRVKTNGLSKTRLLVTTLNASLIPDGASAL